MTLKRSYIFLILAEVRLSILYQMLVVDLSTLHVSVSYIEIHLLFPVPDIWYDIVCIDGFQSVVPLVFCLNKSF